MSNIDYKNTLESLGYKLLDRGDYWQTNAIFRGGDNKTAIQIYKDSGVWKDYVNQTPFLSFKKLVQATIGSNDDELVDSLLKKDIIFNNPHRNSNQPRISMEKTYKKDCLDRLLPHYSFYEDRGISADALKKFKGGLCTEGKMYQRFVFPIFNLNGKIHGFSGRDMASLENRPKWKHIGLKSKWIFPHHISSKYIEDSSEVILVESIGDVLSLYERGFKNILCTFGTLISPTLISYIVGINPSKIILSLNNDLNSELNAGLTGCIKSFFKLISYVDYEKVIICLPNQNDFGEMSEKDYNKWESKKEKLIKSFNYQNIINTAENICSKSKQPDVFIKKIKKFKKELNNE